MLTPFKMLTGELDLMALRKAISQVSSRPPQLSERFLPVILLYSTVPASFTAAILFSVPPPTPPILPALRYKGLLTR